METVQMCIEIAAVHTQLCMNYIKFTQPKLEPTMVQTYDLWIMTSKFYVPEMLILTNEPSETSTCKTCRHYTMFEFVTKEDA